MHSFIYNSHNTTNALWYIYTRWQISSKPYNLILSINLHNSIKRPSPTFLVSIRDARVGIKMVWQFPAPILLPRHRQSWPSIDPYIVLPDFTFTNNTSECQVTAFMTAPYLVTGICTLAPIWMEVPAHGRASALPKRIKISPIFWRPLRKWWYFVRLIGSIRLSHKRVAIGLVQTMRLLFTGWQTWDMSWPRLEIYQSLKISGEEYHETFETNNKKIW